MSTEDVNVPIEDQIAIVEDAHRQMRTIEGELLDTLAEAFDAGPSDSDRHMVARYIEVHWGKPMYAAIVEVVKHHQAIRDSEQRLERLKGLRRSVPSGCTIIDNQVWERAAIVGQRKAHYGPELTNYGWEFDPQYEPEPGEHPSHAACVRDDYTDTYHYKRWIGPYVEGMRFEDTRAPEGHGDVEVYGPDTLVPVYPLTAMFSSSARLPGNAQFYDEQTGETIVWEPVEPRQPAAPRWGGLCHEYGG